MFSSQSPRWWKNRLVDSTACYNRGFKNVLVWFSFSCEATRRLYVALKPLLAFLPQHSRAFVFFGLCCFQDGDKCALDKTFLMMLILTLWENTLLIMALKTLSRFCHCIHFNRILSLQLARKICRSTAHFLHIHTMMTSKIFTVFEPL